MTTRKKRKPSSRATVQAWFEIEEYIDPNLARGNEPYWSPCVTDDGKLYQEPDTEAAEAKFQALPVGTRFRLVFVSRRVISEKE